MAIAIRLFNFPKSAALIKLSLRQTTSFEDFDLIFSAIAALLSFTALLTC
jgi:hypothetical protein